MGRLRVLACLPLATLAIGCGSGGDDKPAKPKPTASKVDDKRVAKEATLKLSDFPSGWKSEPASEDRTSKCAQVEAAKKLVSARNTSDSFSKSQTTLAEGAIYVFPAEDTAQKGYELVSGQESQDCYAQTVVKAFTSQPGVKVGTPQTAHPDIETVGDERSATRVTIGLSAKSVKVDVVVDLVIVRTGRGLSLNLYVNLQQPFDEALRVKLTGATVERLHDGLT